MPFYQDTERSRHGECGEKVSLPWSADALIDASDWLQRKVAGSLTAPEELKILAEGGRTRKSATRPDRVRLPTPIGPTIDLLVLLRSLHIRPLLSPSGRTS